MEKNSSSSKFQNDNETEIIKSLKLYFETQNIELKSNKSHYFSLKDKDNEQVKVQLDICDSENLIFGEIFTCGEKFLAGQQRKIATDLLKLLTIESFLKKESESMKVRKLIILTSFDENDKNPVIKVREDVGLVISKKLLGNTSWKIKAIEMFGFEVLIYFLNETDKKKLDETRKRQGEKFKNK